MQTERRKLYMNSNSQGVSYKIEKKRDIPVAELQELTYDLFKLCAFNLHL